MRIVVLFGGTSEERHVSIGTAAQVVPVLRRLGHEVLAVDLAAGFEVGDAELVFIALHGGAGEDGRIQSMLDLAGLAYTGSNHSASAAAMDKDLSKRLFRSVDVPTPAWHLGPVSAEWISEHLGWPVVVKAQPPGLHGRIEHRPQGSGSAGCLWAGRAV